MPKVRAGASYDAFAETILNIPKGRQAGAEAQATAEPVSTSAAKDGGLDLQRESTGDAVVIPEGAVLRSVKASQGGDSAREAYDDRIPTD